MNLPQEFFDRLQATGKISMPNAMSLFGDAQRDALRSVLINKGILTAAEWDNQLALECDRIAGLIETAPIEHQ
jgi:hypothetical protein